MESKEFAALFIKPGNQCQVNSICKTKCIDKTLIRDANNLTLFIIILIFYEFGLLPISLLFYAQGFTQGLNSGLLTAIKENDLIKIKLLVKQGADINVLDSNHAGMLMWAVYKGDLKTVQYCL